MWINILLLPLLEFGQLHPLQYTFGLAFYRVALFSCKIAIDFYVFIVEPWLKPRKKVQKVQCGVEMFCPTRRQIAP